MFLLCYVDIQVADYIAVGLLFVAMGAAAMVVRKAHQRSPTRVAIS